MPTTIELARTQLYAAGHGVLELTNNIKNAIERGNRLAGEMKPELRVRCRLKCSTADALGVARCEEYLAVQSARTQALRARLETVVTSRQQQLTQ